MAWQDLFKTSRIVEVFRLHSPGTSFASSYTLKEYIEMVLNNPALLKVFALQCDLFSRGKFYVYQDDLELKQDEFLKVIQQPSYHQTESQFLWEVMFWNMIGNTYIYTDSALLDQTSIFCLNPAQIVWPSDMDKVKDKQMVKPEQLKKIKLIYRYADGTELQFGLEKLIHMPDLTNGFGNLFSGPSRLAALKKIIANSEAALDAKNINVRYSGKFLVGSPSDITKSGLSETEKEDLRSKIDSSDQKVWPVKAMISLRRFVENIASLQLDQLYLSDYFLIGNMYGIPRDVLEAYQSATYENQEKARAAHVDYTLEPKGVELSNKLSNRFGYTDKRIILSWEHLPFMKQFEAANVELQHKKIETLKSMLELGISIEQANKFLDTSFVITPKTTI